MGSRCEYTIVTVNDRDSESTGKTIPDSLHGVLHYYDSYSVPAPDGSPTALVSASELTVSGR